MFDSQVHIYDERADYCPSNLGWEALAGIDIESYGRDVDCEIFHDWTVQDFDGSYVHNVGVCLLYTSPSPRDQRGSRMPSSA